MPRQNENQKRNEKLDLVLESSSDSDSDNDDDQIICDDSSDISTCSKQMDRGDENESVKDPNLEELKEGDYVLVNFDCKKKQQPSITLSKLKALH